MLAPSVLAATNAVSEIEMIDRAQSTHDSIPFSEEDSFMPIPETGQVFVWGNGETVQYYTENEAGEKSVISEITRQEKTDQTDKPTESNDNKHDQSKVDTTTETNKNKESTEKKESNQTSTSKNGSTTKK